MPVRRRSKALLPAAIAALAYIILYFSTVVDITADTPVYVTQIFKFSQHRDPSMLWEFGHLVWRPLGYLLWRIFSPVLSSWYGGNPYLEITAVLVGMNFVVGLALTVFLFFVCRKLGLRPGASFAVTFAFISTSTVLNYIHSGMSYNLGFALQVVGLLLLLHGFTAVQPKRAVWQTIFGGIALGLSSVFWFPYALTAGAPILAGWFAGRGKYVAMEERRHLYRLVGVAIVAGFGINILAFGIGAAIDHISTVAEFGQWVRTALMG